MPNKRKTPTVVAACKDTCISLFDLCRYTIPFWCSESYRKLKYAFHRARHGHDPSDVWDFWRSNAERHVMLLTKFRDTKVGVPCEVLCGDRACDTLEAQEAAWNEILNQMIDGWKAILESGEVMYDSKGNVDVDNMNRHYAECYQRFRKGMEVYVRHYTGLWD